MIDIYPALYILMRNDMPSLNSGKAMAQSSHASNAFVKHMNDSFIDSMDKPNTLIQDHYNRWQLDTPQGFGTALVLAVSEVQMRTAVKVADALGFASGIVNDPTYPYLVDSEVVNFVAPGFHTADPVARGATTACFRSEDTCSFIFGDKNDPMLAAVVGRFPLYP